MMEMKAFVNIPNLECIGSGILRLPEFHMYLNPYMSYFVLFDALPPVLLVFTVCNGDIGLVHEPETVKEMASFKSNDRD